MARLTPSASASNPATAIMASTPSDSANQGTTNGRKPACRALSTACATPGPSV
jgi:hypothetical protein